MTQPFCCDITSGTKEEQNEFKRLFEKASKEQWQFDNYYYGYDKYGSWDNWKKSDTAIKLFTRILPLTEGILILKKMVGEEEPSKLTIQELEAIRLSWSLKNFPDATVISSLQKLKSEISEVEKELESKPLNYDSLTEEYADCLMCLFDSAGRIGITPNKIFEAFAVKQKKNQNRIWKKNPDNTYSHVKPTTENQ